MTKLTLEAAIREKFATGYDPIKLSVKSKQINEENIVVLIEGVEFSIVNNTVNCIDKTEPANLAPEPEPTQEQEAIAAELAAESEFGTGTDEGKPEPVSEPATAESLAPSDDVIEGTPESFQNRAVAILAHFGGHQLLAINESLATTYGDLVYDVVEEDGTVLATGSIAQLETMVANAQAAKASA